MGEWRGGNSVLNDVIDSILPNKTKPPKCEDNLINHTYIH